MSVHVLKSPFLSQKLCWQLFDEFSNVDNTSLSYVFKLHSGHMYQCVKCLLHICTCEKCVPSSMSTSLAEAVARLCHSGYLQSQPKLPKRV